MGHQPSALDRAIEQQEREYGIALAQLESSAALYIQALEKQEAVFKKQIGILTQQVWAAAQVSRREEAPDGAIIRRDVFADISSVLRDSSGRDAAGEAAHWHADYHHMKRLFEITSDALDRLREKKENRGATK